MSSVGYTNDTHKSRSQTLTNYIVYQSHGSTSTRVGHYDQDVATIQPLSFASGTALQNLYEVIEAGENGIEAAGQPVPVDSVKISPPLYGRDILCVGKNYSEHAKEFNSSGFDSSDKVDQPSHPVIFTKRFTSIIAHGDEIYPHPKFTSTLDYEGELGVIIGKDGFRISEADAMDHVWGYTIINDMTARERQRDHKQFYIGKSADTFCPMVGYSDLGSTCRSTSELMFSKGPIAVPKEKLNKTLQVQTRVNGEVRQNATTDDLIFSIPYLIMTMSEGQTLMRGDVLATGTVSHRHLRYPSWSLADLS
jgi:2-keto-4-pentenoate hydratase/2-oxohepta-3-ene-1,7-dioic acid hydratase in catechol pathway